MQTANQVILAAGEKLKAAGAVPAPKCTVLVACVAPKLNPPPCIQTITGSLAPASLKSPANTGPFLIV